jgi:hypothetical protein
MTNGGWTAIGIEETILRSVPHDIVLSDHSAILDAALGFQRQAGVWPGLDPVPALTPT